MATAIIGGKPIKVEGRAACVGGKHPDPPLDDYWLLAWCPDHPEHGSMVFTEDGRATVHDIAVASAQTPGFDELAKQFGTTGDHIAHALAYAARAGFFEHED